MVHPPSGSGESAVREFQNPDGEREDDGEQSGSVRARAGSGRGSPAFPHPGDPAPSETLRRHVRNLRENPSSGPIWELCFTQKEAGSEEKWSRQISERMRRMASAGARVGVTSWLSAWKSRRCSAGQTARKARSLSRDAVVILLNAERRNSEGVEQEGVHGAQEPWWHEKRQGSLYSLRSVEMTHFMPVRANRSASL